LLHLDEEFARLSGTHEQYNQQMLDLLREQNDLLKRLSEKR